MDGYIFLWLKVPTALTSGPRDLLITLAATIPSPSISSISYALMYSSKSENESASGIDSGVLTAGSYNAIGCGGGVMESPSLDVMIRSKVSRFNDSAALKCLSWIIYKMFGMAAHFLGH